jgi:hypothetical protein
LAKSRRVRREIPILFQRMMASNPEETPYASHSATPTRKEIVNGRLISLALLREITRNICGMKPRVVKTPAISPNPA